MAQIQNFLRIGVFLGSESLFLGTLLCEFKYFRFSKPPRLPPPPDPRMVHRPEPGTCNLYMPLLKQLSFKRWYLNFSKCKNRTIVFFCFHCRGTFYKNKIPSAVDGGGFFWRGGGGYESEIVQPVKLSAFAQCNFLFISGQP